MGSSMIGLYKHSAKCQRSKNEQANIIRREVSCRGSDPASGCSRDSLGQGRKYYCDRVQDASHVELYPIHRSGRVPDAPHVELRPVHRSDRIPDAALVELHPTHLGDRVPDTPHVGLCPIPRGDHLSGTPFL